LNWGTFRLRTVGHMKHVTQVQED